jgi:hypothetical protein
MQSRCNGIKFPSKTAKQPMQTADATKHPIASTLHRDAKAGAKRTAQRKKRPQHAHFFTASAMQQHPKDHHSQVVYLGLHCIGFFP